MFQKASALERKNVTADEAPPVVPVTSLQFTEHFLLSGEGSYCHLYQMNTWSHVASRKIFASSSIHGIRRDTSNASSRVCFFGARSLRVVSLTNSPGSEIGHCWNEIRVNDWIWDCTWLRKLPSDGVGSDADLTPIAAVLGHNTIICIDFKSGAILNHVKCQESCILYSAKLVGHTWCDLVALVGTVFNQVVLWAVCGPLNDLGHAEVMHVLTGHQGVVMGIDCDMHRRQICSVSDDRSLRIWQIKTSVEARSEGGDGLTHDDFATVDDWQTASFQQVHILYGHSARVWDTKILVDGYISVGEDATCCVWDSSGHISQKFKGHQGKSIWSLAVSSDESLLATGGGDTSIRIWHRNAAFQLSENISMSRIEMPGCKAGDFPRIVKFLNASAVLVLSNKGCLSCYDVVTESWSVIMDDPAYASYGVVSPDPSGSLVAIGNISGWVRLLLHTAEGRMDEVLEEQFFKGKVHNILWISGLDDGFLTCGPEGQMFLCQLRSPGESGRRSVVRLCELVLPPCKQRWVTSACLVLHVPLLVCGDREGSIHVYHSLNLSHRAASSRTQPYQSFGRLHGSSEVTDVLYHAGQVYTSGQDGYYRVFTVTAEDGLQLLSSCRVLKGLDWLSRLIFHMQDILVLGFHSNRFVAYSTNSNQCVLAVPCGGGHRAWDFTLSLPAGDCCLIYIKKRGIAFYNAKMLSYQDILKPSLHGCETTAIRHLASFPVEWGIQHFVSTAGEDGRLILLSLTESKEDGFDVSPLQVISSTQIPASSIRAVGVSMCRGDCVKSADSFLRRSVLFSCGSKGQLLAWKLHLTENVPDSGLWESLASHSLCAKPRKRLKPWKQLCYNPDVETRYMDVSAFCLSELMDQLPNFLHVVIAVCSVGVLRVFLFDEKSRVFHLIASSSFHEHCLLRVQHFFHTSKSNGQETKTVYILSVGTDGCIALWDITEVILNFYRHHFTSSRLCSSGSHSTSTIHSCNITSNASSAYGLDNSKSNSKSFMDSSEIVQNLSCNSPKTLDSALNLASEETLSRTKLAKRFSVSEDLSAEESSSEASYSLDSEDEDLVIDESLQTLAADNRRLDGSGGDLDKPVLVLEVHQSGINTLDIKQLQGESSVFSLASGGDDNALHLHILDLANGAGGIVVLHHEVCVSAHAAQISGIRFLDELTLVSISLDQRLTFWTLGSDVSHPKLKAICTKYTDVADVSHLESWADKDSGSENGFRLLVCGIGFQFFRVQLSSAASHVNDEETDEL